MLFRSVAIHPSFFYLFDFLSSLFCPPLPGSSLGALHRRPTPDLHTAHPELVLLTTGSIQNVSLFPGPGILFKC